jgi:hypothetical protein
VYCLVNEQNKSVADLWDGHVPKCTFRRCVDIKVFNLWEEVVSLAATIDFSDDDDAMVWQFQGGYPSLHTSGLETGGAPSITLLPLAIIQRQASDQG